MRAALVVMSGLAAGSTLTFLAVLLFLVTGDAEPFDLFGNTGGN